VPTRVDPVGGDDDPPRLTRQLRANRLTVTRFFPD